MEEIILEKYETGHQLRKITQEYVTYYKNRRPHQSVSYKTTVEYYFCDNKQLFEAVYRLDGALPLLMVK